jgi:hypothetical protein
MTTPEPSPAQSDQDRFKEPCSQVGKRLPQPSQANPGKLGKWAQPTVFFFMLVILAVRNEWNPGNFLFSYVAALMLVNYLMPWLGLSDFYSSLTVGRRAVILLFILGLPAVVLVRAALDHEVLKSLAGTREFVRDKWNLQKFPSLFPAVVSKNRPQRFFIYSPDSEELTVRFGSGGTDLSTESLGHGLFMLDFNPRGGALADIPGGPLEVVLTADGKHHDRTVQVVESSPHPRWFSASPSAGVAATVSEETDELILIHRDGTFQRVAVDDGPTDCALFAGGTKVAVSHKFQPSLCIVDVADGRIIARHELSRFQVRLAISPDETILAVAQQGETPGIQFLSLPGGQKLDWVSLPFSPDWIAFGRDSKELVVTDRVGRRLHRVRAGAAPGEASPHPWTLEENPLHVARPVVTMCRASGGSEVVFSTTSIELNHDPIEANHFIEDTIHHLDLAKWEVTSQYPTQRGGLNQDEPGTTEHGASPMGITSYGDSLMIAFAGTNEIATATAKTGATLDFTYIDEEPLNAPHGVADLGEGVWCVSSPIDSTIGIFNEEREIQHLIRLGREEVQLAVEDPLLLEQIHGERTFYEATRSGVSCQSCHLHTTTDHCMHSIGAAELVGVLTVHGIAGTSPYLRDGSYPQLIGLHSVVLDVYRDYEIAVDWDRAAALETYMNSLPPETNWRSLEPGDVERMRHGMEAFVKAECIHCHVPPAMSNLGLHPTNVIFPEYGATLEKEPGIRNFLDVPQLVGVSLTPPYLHNGRAATLEEIFRDHNSSDRHGKSSVLSDGEFGDLVYFLEQL